MGKEETTAVSTTGDVSQGPGRECELRRRVTSAVTVEIICSSTSGEMGEMTGAAEATTLTDSVLLDPSSDVLAGMVVVDTVAVAEDCNRLRRRAGGELAKAAVALRLDRVARLDGIII